MHGSNLQTFVQQLRNLRLDHLIDYTLLTRLAISVLLTYVTFKPWITSIVVGRPQLYLCGTQFRQTFYCGMILWGGEQSWGTFKGLLWCNCICDLIYRNRFKSGIPTFRNGTGRDGTIPEIVAVLFYGTGRLHMHALRQWVPNAHRYSTGFLDRIQLATLHC